VLHTPSGACQWRRTSTLETDVYVWCYTLL